MQKIIKYIVTITILNSVVLMHSYAKENWAPIVMNEITTFISYKTDPSELSLSNIHPMNITKNSVKIFWDVSDYSIAKDIEVNANHLEARTKFM